MHLRRRESSFAQAASRLHQVGKPPAASSITDAGFLEGNDHDQLLQRGAGPMALMLWLDWVT
jgi:hypothetical protein